MLVLRAVGLRRRRLVAAAAALLLVTTLIGWVPADRAGAMTPYELAQCATTVNPEAGARQQILYTTPTVTVRRFSKAGLSPVFTSAANLRNARVLPLLNVTTTNRRQVRDMMGTARAAVNGDFFTSNLGSLGVEVAAGGRVVKGTSSPELALVSDARGVPSVGDVSLNIHLTHKLSSRSSATVAAQSYNTLQVRPNAIAVYDNNFSAGVNLGQIGWYPQPTLTYIVVTGHIAQIVPGVAARPVAPGGLLVVAQGDGVTSLVRAGWQRGAAVSLSVGASAPGVARVGGAVGAGVWMLHQGHVTPYACGYDQPTPRTMIGVYSGGTKVIMVAASGRGLTMRQANSFMRSLGVSDAVMFDGGGSTVMTMRTRHPVQLTVHPYRTEGDRPVPNGIGIYAR